MFSKTLIISEIFSSLQGEGKNIGSPSVFVRLGGCNLSCGIRKKSDWKCDTYDIWTKGKPYDIDDLFSFIDSNYNLNYQNLIITGGEPLIQQNNLELFLKKVKKKYQNIYIEIETNATISPNFSIISLIDLFNFSPKLNNSGEKLNKRKISISSDLITNLKDYIFKFVIKSEEDILELQYYQNILNIPNKKIFLMPACLSKYELEDIKHTIYDISKKYYYNYSHRLQIDFFDSLKGV